MRALALAEASAPAMTGAAVLIGGSMTGERAPSAATLSRSAETTKTLPAS